MHASQDNNRQHPRCIKSRRHSKAMTVRGWRASRAITSINSLSMSMSCIVTTLFSRQKTFKNTILFRSSFQTKKIIITNNKKTFRPIPKRFHHTHVKNAIATSKTLNYYNSSIFLTILILYFPSSIIHSKKIALSSDEEKEQKGKQDNKSNDELDENCPFCQYFIQSPCKESFLPWRKCVQVRILLAHV